MNEKINENVKSFIEHMAKITVRISSWNENQKLLSRASGFLYKNHLLRAPIVITAGHRLPEIGSFIETGIIKDGKTLSINAGNFRVFYNHEDMDYAYSQLPINLYQNEKAQYSDIELITYQHNFVKAEKNETYGFAVINDYGEFVHAGNGFILPSYCCFEIGLELVEQEKHLNFFKLSRNFQGHEYYQGASGSPIANTEGAITSILVGGSQETGLLRAFRLDNLDIIENIGHHHEKN